jgi:uncharacterized protein with PIN domain
MSFCPKCASSLEKQSIYPQPTGHAVVVYRCTGTVRHYWLQRHLGGMGMNFEEVLKRNDAESVISESDVTNTMIPFVIAMGESNWSWD